MEKIAFLFAGQGSQYVGMGKDFYEEFSESKIIFNQASDVLGFDLTHLCFEGPHEALKATTISQPAIVTVTMAAWEVFRRRIGIEPAFCAGLSLGEYSALIAAGVFSFRNGVMLVRKRGEIMEEAAKNNPGTMAAILDLAQDKIQEACAMTGVEIANLNCPGQVVITGKSDAVSNAVALCKQAGAKRAVLLEVSGAFHSSLMRDAAEKLKVLLNQVPMQDARISVISNYTAQPQQACQDIRLNLVKQLYSSVRWEESMRFMLVQGVTKFYEFGPGKILKGLVRKIDANANVISIDKKEDIINFNS